MVILQLKVNHALTVFRFVKLMEFLGKVVQDFNFEDVQAGIEVCREHFSDVIDF